MRLIDRQAVIDALWNIQRGLQMMDSERVDKTIHGIQLALHTIEQMPTVDAVPIAWLQNHITTIEQQRLLDEWAERKEE